MKITNKNILSFKHIPTPDEIKKEIPSFHNKNILKFRNEIEDILNGNNNRFIIIVGPCSIHDKDSAIEYAKRLRELSEKVKDKILIIMRTYFEKPRSTKGWKGLIYDPRLNETNKIDEGIKEARKILIEITEIGLPSGTEFLSHITPQYIDDLIAWSAIGARTTESQTHREMASGLSMPVGFKNDTKGDAESAINAIKSANSKHTFFGINDHGDNCIVCTKGNRYSHLILRGGEENGNFLENYSQHKIVSEKMIQNDIPPNIIIDCSHGNSGKNFENQPEVFEKIVNFRKEDNAIKGAMLESNLHQGNQKLSQDNIKSLKYGVSITDSCISWETTEKIILGAYKKL